MLDQGGAPAESASASTPSVGGDVGGSTAASSPTPGSSAAGDYNWGDWSPDRDDLPEQYRPAISAARAYYEKQLAEMADYKQRADFYANLWDSNETGQSSSEIAGLYEAKYELEDVRKQFDELNAQSSGWSAEKQELTERANQLQQEIEQIRSQLPEIENQMRTALNQEYTKLLEQDVDAFFAQYGDKLQDEKIANEFMALREKGMGDVAAVNLAQMSQPDIAFAKELLDGGTNPDKVMALVARAAKERAPAVSQSATLTGGAAPVSKVSSQTSTAQDRRGAGPNSQGNSRFPRTMGLLSQNQ
jgi:predicted transcriptional regulator